MIFETLHRLNFTEEDKMILKNVDISMNLERLFCKIQDRSAMSLTKWLNKHKNVLEYIPESEWKFANPKNHKPIDIPFTEACIKQIDVNWFIPIGTKGCKVYDEYACNLHLNREVFRKEKTMVAFIVELSAIERNFLDKIRNAFRKGESVAYIDKEIHDKLSSIGWDLDDVSLFIPEYTLVMLKRMKPVVAFVFNDKSSALDFKLRNW